MFLKRTMGCRGRSGEAAWATAIGLMLSAVAGTPVRADIICVPDDYPTIQEAIDAAVDGDEVVMADGTWTGAGNKNLDFQAKTLTLRSESGDRALCIIDCEGDGRFATLGAGDAATVRGLTIVNGNVGTGLGGAVLLESGSVARFEDCSVQACGAEYGGAI